MATKLKNLKVTNVDFVDEGANPDANILLKKSKDDSSAGKSNEKSGGFFKRFFSFVGKATGMNEEEIDSAIDEFQKGKSATFTDVLNQRNREQVTDEIWNICHALNASFCSIIYDEEMDSTSAVAAMQQSLSQFQSTVSGCITRWANYETVGIAKNETEEVKPTGGSDSTPGDPVEKNDEPKGEETEMKIDKSKLTESELMFLESIEKRCGTEDKAEEGSAPEADVAKSADTEQNAEQETNVASDDIYKGIHPAVKAELEALKKFRDEAENKEMLAVAKKYEIIGKKPEELAPVLKSLKAAGGTAYTDMIAVLDQTVEAVEKSGVFSEVGKSGHSAGENSAEAKIGAIAKGLMEKDPTLNYTQAVAKAWENNPDLMAEYDEQAGF